MSTEVLKIQSEARDLVARSRLGDQNATAMLVMIKNSALAGSKRAQYTFKYLADYIKKHPVVTKLRIGFGGDPATQRVINAIHSHINGDPSNHAAVMVAAIPRIGHPKLAAVPLANSGDLLHKDNPRISAICGFYNEAQMDAFEFGRCNCFGDDTSMHGDMTAGEQEALHMGKSIGIAQRIQAVRYDDTPISVLSKIAAWELGE